MCAAVEEMNIEAILAVMNTIGLVVEIRPEKKKKKKKKKKIRAQTGFEPMIQRSTN